MVTHGLSPSGSSYHLLGGTGRGCTMTQTHPTSEVAALVPTEGEKSLCCPLLLPHPPLGKFLSQNCSHPPRREFLSFSGFNHASEISREWTVGGSSKRGGGSSGELLKTQELLNLPVKERSRWGLWVGRRCECPAHKAQNAQPSSATRSPGEPDHPVSCCIPPNVAMKIAGPKLKRVEESP